MIYVCNRTELKERVETWIIKKAKKKGIRFIFHASDIAEELHVDVFKIMDILDELKNEGKVRKTFE